MELKDLEILGLTNGEIKVYSAVLDIGIANINKIHEKTGLERRGIYDIINKLIEKGLVSYAIEKGKRTYQCSPINNLKNKIKQEQEKLKELENKLPKLEEIYNSKKPLTRFEIFRGKEAIKTIFEDMLNYKDVWVIGGGMYITYELPDYWEEYNKRRIKSGTIYHNLVINELKGKTKDIKLMPIKVLPKEFSGNPTAIIIYGNKTINISWTSEIFAILIENKEIAENYKKYHKYLWDNIAE
jgi:HTH-type transcriptional regulator, sugar sensing transcriptional regulator